MKNLSSKINEYLIEMVNDKEVRDSLEYRAKLTPMERDDTPMPLTKTMNDAFYVVLGCKFQDAPVQTFLAGLIFIVVVGFTIANFIMSMI